MEGGSLGGVNDCKREGQRKISESSSLSVSSLSEYFLVKGRQSEGKDCITVFKILTYLETFASNVQG